jgi:signal transduction histidine kinase
MSVPRLRFARTLVAAALGIALGVVELAFLVLVWPMSAVPAARPIVRRAAAKLTAWERARRGDRGPLPPPDYRFIAARALLGTISGYVAACGLLLSGLLLFGAVWELRADGTDAVPLRFPGIYLVTDSSVLGLTIGLALLILTLLWIRGIGGAQRWLAAALLGPDERDRLRRRVAELTITRSEVVRAIDDERRRIERDLHDGVQQRGVALSMLLGRARHRFGEPTAAAALVDQAYAESRLLLDEVRNVAWRIYPTALDELGLRAALAGVAERSVVPVSVHGRLGDGLVSEVETAVYFVAREAIANAVKHADAHDILVVLDEDERTVRVVVSDDGKGGADPSGSGLRGLARRVQALDGTFEVRSPVGGPTRVTAALPKALPCD